MILLYHETTTGGMIATNSDPIHGDPVGPRRYYHEGNYVVIDGQTHIVEHDVEDILKIAGYRLATAKEQEAYYAAKRHGSSLTEVAPHKDSPSHHGTKEEPKHEESPPHHGIGKKEK